MPRKMLEEMRVNLINELGRLYDEGYDLSSPVVIHVAEVLDEVVDQIMEYELHHRVASASKEETKSEIRSEMRPVLQS